MGAAAREAPAFDGVRSDPRYDGFRRRIGVPMARGTAAR